MCGECFRTPFLRRVHFKISWEESLSSQYMYSYKWWKTFYAKLIWNFMTEHFVFLISIMYFRKPRLRHYWRPAKPIDQLPARRQTRYLCTKIYIYVFYNYHLFQRVNFWNRTYNSLWFWAYLIKAIPEMRHAH